MDLTLLPDFQETFLVAVKLKELLREDRLDQALENRTELELEPSSVVLLEVQLVQELQERRSGQHLADVSLRSYSDQV